MNKFGVIVMCAVFVALVECNRPLDTKGGYGGALGGLKGGQRKGGVLVGIKGQTQQREEQTQLRERYPSKGGVKTQQREEQYEEQLQQRERYPSKGGIKTQQREDQQQEEIYERKGQYPEQARKTIITQHRDNSQGRWAVKRPQTQQREDTLQQREVKQLPETRQPQQADTVLYESDWD